MALIIVAAIAAITMVLCLLLHYEVLRWLHFYSPRLRERPRTRIGMVFGALILTHLVEIWIFSFGYYLLDRRPGLGLIQGDVTSYWDYVYFSGVVYATIVFGELLPVGNIRFYVAMEAFAGLFMITWSAIFLFESMQNFWQEQKR